MAPEKDPLKCAISPSQQSAEDAGIEISISSFFFSHAIKKNLWEGPAYVLTQNQDIQLLVRDTSRASSNFATLPKAGKMPWARAVLGRE